MSCALQMRRDDPKFMHHMWTQNDYASLASLERQLRLYVAKLRTMLESIRQQVPPPVLPPAATALVNAESALRAHTVTVVAAPHHQCFRR